MIEENEASPLNDASAPSNHQSRISEAHSTVSVKRFETYPSENKWTDLVKLPLASGVWNTDRAPVAPWYCNDNCFQ